MCGNKIYSKANKDFFSSKLVEIHKYIISIYSSWDFNVQKSIVNDTEIVSVSNKLLNFYSVYW